jgi:hypothetical protein
MNFCRKLPAMLALCLTAALPLSVVAQENKPLTLEDLHKEIKAWRDGQQVTMQILKDEVASLTQRLAALEQKTQVRTSFSPPQTGTIRLENRFAAPATILINDVPYRLQPFQTQVIPAQPAGTFTFEVLVDGYGSQLRATRSLQANQVYRIFTYPTYEP